MARVSHSLLDPYLTVPLKRHYHQLPIPRSFPPEGLIALGHLSAILGGIGFVFSTTTWWGGLLAAAGVAGNHLADIFDGTHARETGQCRHGGELLDHFTDPLSFSYWIAGLSIGIGQPELGIAGVIVLYATAVLTNIKAKLTGEFALSAFGPTEFKSLLVLWGLCLALLSGLTSAALVASVAFWGYVTLLSVGVVQLIMGLMLGVREVNQLTAAPDTEEWVTVRDDANQSGLPGDPAVSQCQRRSA